MSNYSRQEILEEAKKLASMLASTDEIERFKVLEAKVNENPKIERLINKIKTLQKSAVNLESLGKTEALKKVEAEITACQAELDELPVVAEFQEIQVVVNDMLQLVSGTIAREVTNKIIRDTDGDILSGQTGSKVENKTACGEE